MWKIRRIVTFSDHYTIKIKQFIYLENLNNIKINNI